MGNYTNYLTAQKEEPQYNLGVDYNSAPTEQAEMASVQPEQISSGVPEGAAAGPGGAAAVVGGKFLMQYMAQREADRRAKMQAQMQAQQNNYNMQTNAMENLGGYWKTALMGR